MKIVLVHGQNHKGSTYHIAKMLWERIDSSAQVREFFLPKDLNAFCIGCYNCIVEESRCPYYEEKMRIMKEVETADLLIFDTPTYCLAPSAGMKTFMDLTFSYWMSHRPRACMFSKKAVVISTAAGAGTKGAMKPVKAMLGYWGISDVKTYGISLQAMNWDGVSEKKKNKITKDMQKLGKTLGRKLSKQKSPDVSLKVRFLFTMMSWMQKAGMGGSKEDRQYWVEQGWLTNKRPWRN